MWSFGTSVVGIVAACVVVDVAAAFVVADVAAAQDVTCAACGVRAACVVAGLIWSQPTLDLLAGGASGQHVAQQIQSVFHTLGAINANAM